MIDIKELKRFVEEKRKDREKVTEFLSKFRSKTILNMLTICLLFHFDIKGELPPVDDIFWAMHFKRKRSVYRYIRHFKELRSELLEDDTPAEP